MLGIEPGEPTTTWTISLEAWNAQHKMGHADAVTVVIDYVTG